MRKFSKINWLKAPDIKKRLGTLIDQVGLTNFKKQRVFAVRSVGANTRAIARIWGLSKLWQQVLGETPAYIVEVISERFDKLSEHQKNEVLLHELAHIPNNFSGALAPHKRGKGHFHDKLKKMLTMYRRTG